MLVRLACVVLACAATPEAQPVLSASREVAEISSGLVGVEHRAPIGPATPSATGALLVSAATTVGIASVGALLASGDGEMAAYLVAAGLVIGPSAGNAWLDEPGDALTGLAIRAAGAGAMIYGLRNFDIVAGSSTTADGYIFLAGGIAYLVGLGYDLRTQYVNGRAANVRVRQRGAGLALVVRV